jgi:guanylate kinase
MTERNTEGKTESGRLVVITGRSGSGKDVIMDQMLNERELKQLGFRKLVTHATRAPREGEIEGYSYYFISEEEMLKMYENGELVEPPTQTGDSLKATSKSELLKVIDDAESLIWRIDLSRAAQIVSGDFFTSEFDPDLAKTFEACTKVFLIESEEPVLVLRRKERDGEKYDPEQYRLRDEQDLEVLNKFGKFFSRKIENPQGDLDSAVKEIVKSVFE